MNQTTDTIEVWDIAVRLFHWTLVIAFAVSYLSEGEPEWLHVWSGYLIVALVAFRVIWGFTGGRHARFSEFLRSPAKTISYIKSVRAGRPDYYEGHNPAGGWMIIALLICLSLTCFSGLQTYAADGKGPLASVDVQLISAAIAHEAHDSGEEEESEEEKFWKEVHEFFANLTLALVILHIIGVILASRQHGENLTRAMVTGRKARR